MNLRCVFSICCASPKRPCFSYAFLYWELTLQKEQIASHRPLLNLLFFRLNKLISLSFFLYFRWTSRWLSLTDTPQNMLSQRLAPHMGFSGCGLMSVEQREEATTLDKLATVSPRQPRVCWSPICREVSVLGCYEKLQTVILKQVISANLYFFLLFVQKCRTLFLCSQNSSVFHPSNQYMPYLMRYSGTR